MNVNFNRNKNKTFEYTLSYRENIGTLMHWSSVTSLKKENRFPRRKKDFHIHFFVFVIIFKA